MAKKYAFTELYDSTKTVAKQIAEKDKFQLVGQFRGTSANVISLGAYNVPQGSVVVTAGGVTLSEGADYSVDYSAGEVTILNQSILDAGTSINVSLESQSYVAQERKTMLGLNWEYDFSKNFQVGGTIMHLSEQPLTTKVNMGAEPLNNTIWGVNLNWKKESQWLTNVLDKLPFLHLTQPSHISLSAEFAQLIAGQSKGTQDNASYLDDFEETKSTIDVSRPTSWIISSVPTDFPESSDKTTLRSGYNRSLLAWYSIDPLFTRRSSSLTPGHIKSDLNQLSNHYVREVPVRELFPNREQSNYSGAVSTLSVLNLAYYPSERGPYNFNPDLNADGTLNNPKAKWGGMMRKLDTNDFELANIEYVEFWMLDPFIYSNQQADASRYGGDFYINLGEMSEDVLHDGKKFYESGMPVDGSNAWTTTQWGRIPTQPTVSYAFATTAGSRTLQDVGFNGLTDKEEQEFASYQDFLTAARSKTNQAVFDSIWADPANDDYHYFRGSDWDRIQAPILDRYKRINNPQGNSPDNENNNERYDTSYKTTPDVEDINQDYTLNEYEKYYQYKVSIRPEDLVVGQNYIVDKRSSVVTLQNGNKEEATWYQFRIPLTEYQKRVGGISDFTSIRFMRMFLSGFERPVVLRFGTLDLVSGKWRQYQQNLTNAAATSGSMVVSAVSIEENNDKTPVNYVLPPGIERGQDPSQPQLVQDNEQSLAMTVNNLATRESKAVYKNTTLDIRQYKRLQMFVHANALEQNTTSLTDNQLAVFVRLGSDYKNNYYEYEIPLKLTPHRDTPYDQYSYADCRAVWPEENMLDIPLDLLTSVKKQRNQGRANGTASYNREFSVYDEAHPANRVSIMGNPTLGEVKTMIIGVRNLAGSEKSGEVWVNELRLREFNNEGGWAARGQLNIQLSDFGTIDVNASRSTDGFGGLEQGVSERQQETMTDVSVTTSLELGKFFPDKAKVSAPLYYSVTKSESRPKYNPLDTDMRLADALDGAADKRERDSIESIAVTKRTTTNFSLSNVRVGIQTKRHPMPYDPANFSFSYSHSHTHTSGETTVYENEDNWRGALNYSWTPVYKPFAPFKKLIKSRSKWFDILRRFELNWLPQNVAFNTEMTRNYYELQERDMESTENSMLPLTFNEQFLWNRDFSLRWDLTRNLHLNFQSATHAEVEEPYTPVNKSLYPDRYDAWRDSVKQSIRNFGSPLDYQQNFTLSYQSPLNLIPAFDWVNADANYTAAYTWVRGTDLEDGTSLGNTITTNRSLNINGTLNMEKLYNHSPFLKKTNERFNKSARTSPTREKKLNRSDKPKPSLSSSDKTRNDKEKQLPKNQKSFEKEVTIKADTTLVVSHGKKTKRILVSTRTAEGKTVKLKWKKMDDNSIKLFNKTDSAIRLKLTVTPKEPLDDKGWYKTAQCIARVLMMVRNVSVSYRNQYSMSLPGFMPTVGDAFGQRRGTGAMSPGLDFAFGLVDDGYIDKARENGWLLINDSVATPVSTNNTEDVQLRMTLEPVKDLKIDLTASRTQTKSKSIQYMYVGNPTTQSGTMAMTTISIGSAFESKGNANNGYRSAAFEKFVNSLDGYRDRVEARYRGATYPASFGGGQFDPAVGAVNKYSADVMIPAFLDAYTGMSGNGLGLFPKLRSLLPNWTIRYSGLSRLPFFQQYFKSVNINHGYSSRFSIGSYQSYSTWQEYMGDLGFIADAATGNPVPSSMFNIPMVSITENFSPLLGIDLTMQNNLTIKMEYKKTRNLMLSMTSVQLNESDTKDWVLGFGYRVNNINLFGPRNRRLVKNSRKANGNGSQQNGKDGQTARTTQSTGFNHDLNLRFDLHYVRQAAITRDIATLTSSASSGNTAFSVAFMADYTLSRLVTAAVYYNLQINTPLLSAGSYPTTTHDFGVSLKLSLTR
ncbi:T9SS outer membrane translocon Sov/SprA [Prevotella dentasini]|uniref:T9SS outer membrane translocon Sov/SprA n=1 Tax=Prevotella dentasini TaxID=589537 RepID=UPI00357159DB